MVQLDDNIAKLKKSVLEMMTVVNSQVEKVGEVVKNNDSDIAEEILVNEKLINAAELKIDRDCENFLALYTPVAADLRFVIATMKIATFLERIGDNTKGIAGYLIDMKGDFPKELIQEIQFDEMFATALQLVKDAATSFEEEDTKVARKVFKKDKELNKINKLASAVTLKHIQSNPDDGINHLFMLSVIRKLERIGDLAKNIAEETIFYVDAKVLKHKKAK